MPTRQKYDSDFKRAAINWVRGQSPNTLPILGATRKSQLLDNLGALEFTLSDEQRARLSAANPAPVYYPHTFWNEYVRRDLIFGERVALFDSSNRLGS